jgi:hypothetical protein
VQFSGNAGSLQCEVHEHTVLWRADDVFAAMASEAAHFSYEALAVPRDALNVGFVSDRRHLAYNYFTKLLLEHRCHGVENAVMYADAKSRMKEDNFLEYLVVEMNLGVPFRKGFAPRRVL